MRRAGVLHGRRQTIAGGRRGREDLARGPRRASRVVRAARAWRAAEDVVDHPGHGARRGVHTRADPRARRHRACARHDGSHGRRALCERAHRRRLFARRAHVEIGCGRSLLRRHQEWRNECRGRGVLRSCARRGLRVPPQARRAALLQGPLRRRAIARVPGNGPLAPQCRVHQQTSEAHRRRRPALPLRAFRDQPGVHAARCRAHRSAHPAGFRFLSPRRMSPRCAQRWGISAS
jgi:hypothetical protein